MKHNKTGGGKTILKMVHDCPALGKNAIVPRAHNTAYPDIKYYRCPFCSYTIEAK